MEWIITGLSSNPKRCKAIWHYEGYQFQSKIVIFHPTPQCLSPFCSKLSSQDRGRVARATEVVPTTSLSISEHGPVDTRVCAFPWDIKNCDPLVWVRSLINPRETEEYNNVMCQQVYWGLFEWVRKRLNYCRLSRCSWDGSFQSGSAGKRLVPLRIESPQRTCIE